jgi:hypothetical protein
MEGKSESIDQTEAIVRAHDTGLAMKLVGGRRDTETPTRVLPVLDLEACSHIKLAIASLHPPFHLREETLEPFVPHANTRAMLFAND